MKIYLILLFLGSITFSQQYEDVITLKNRSVIHGIIIERKPNKYIKIKSGKHIFLFQMDEIDTIKKELITEINVDRYNPYTGEKIQRHKYNEDKIESNNYLKNNSISIGCLTNKSMNMIQYTKDIRLSENMAIFGVIGFFNHYGLGLSWQEDYNENGYLIGLSFIKNDDYDFMSFAVSNQKLFGNHTNFFSLGLMIYYRFPNENKIENKHALLSLAPIISMDFRF